MAYSNYHMLEIDETCQDMYNESYGGNFTFDKNGTGEQSVLAWKGVDLGKFTAIASDLKSETFDYRLYGCNEQTLNSTQPHRHNNVIQLGSDVTVGTDSSNGGNYLGGYKHIIMTVLNGSSGNMTNCGIVDIFGKQRF